MALAAEARIRAAGARLVEVNHRSLLLVERFDRIGLLEGGRTAVPAHGFRLHRRQQRRPPPEPWLPVRERGMALGGSLRHCRHWRPRSRHRRRPGWPNPQSGEPAIWRGRLRTQAGRGVQHPRPVHRGGKEDAPRARQGWATDRTAEPNPRVPLRGGVAGRRWGTPGPAESAAGKLLPVIRRRISTPRLDVCAIQNAGNAYGRVVFVTGVVHS